MSETPCYAMSRIEPPSPRTQIVFRYGYVVGGAVPRFVGHTTARDGIYWRDALTDAEELAQSAAAEVRDKLADLGAPTIVSWWVQQRTTACDVTYGEPTIQTLAGSQRDD